VVASNQEDVRRIKHLRSRAHACYSLDACRHALRAAHRLGSVAD
jgi:sulfite reductase beta subunit-like hemoprotein